MTHTINKDQTVAVAIDYYWLPINMDTPRGVKIQLLGIGGVAAYGIYDGKNKFWRAWAPMPKIPEYMK
jgi:hypothetical protein